MRSSSILAAGASLFGMSSAIIDGFYLPSTVAAGANIEIKIEGVDYIQSVQDVAMSFGISGQYPHPESLGDFIDSAILGPEHSNFIGNTSHYLNIPASYPSGPATFSGALFSLIGAGYSPATSFFAANVTVSTYTSSDLVRSEEVY